MTFILPMNNLITQIEALQQISQELNPTVEEREYINAQIHEFINNFLKNIESYPAYVQGNPNIEKLSIQENRKNLNGLHQLQSYCRKFL